MQNIVINMCEKFHYSRLRNDRALENGKFDNNKNKKNNAWGPQKSSASTITNLFTSGDVV